LFLFIRHHLDTSMTLAPLLSKAVREHLSEADAREAALALMSGDVPPSQVGGLLGALRGRGECGSEILGFARALRERATPFPLPPDGLIDTCGTGGDGLGTFNVSTLAGLVAAAAGARVAKHGNRAVSSRCGSADLLDAFGVRVDADASFTAACIETTGFGFLFAPRYHATLRHIAPVRRELGFRSIFNLVGPLANPARARRQVVGVPDAAYLVPVAEALANLGCEHALVVRGHDGADEISLTGATDVIEVKDGVRSAFTLRPEDVGFTSCDPSDLSGGDARANAAIALDVLSGARGPASDFVVLNAGAALLVASRATTLQEGVALARHALQSQKALAVLHGLKRLSQEAA
jgi:anthranilate phosphoribosyltransferase